MFCYCIEAVLYLSQAEDIPNSAETEESRAFKEAAHSRLFHPVTHFLCVSTADLLVNALCLPFTLVYTLQGEWRLGGTLCFLLPYAQGLAVHVSTVTLNVIALDRHR